MNINFIWKSLLFCFLLFIVSLSESKWSATYNRIIDVWHWKRSTIILFLLFVSQNEKNEIPCILDVITKEVLRLFLAVLFCSLFSKRLWNKCRNKCVTFMFTHNYNDILFIASPSISTSDVISASMLVSVFLINLKTVYFFFFGVPFKCQHKLNSVKIGWMRENKMGTSFSHIWKCIKTKLKQKTVFRNSY